MKIGVALGDALIKVFLRVLNENTHRMLVCAWNTRAEDSPPKIPSENACLACVDWTRIILMRRLYKIENDIVHAYPKYAFSKCVPQDTQLSNAYPLASSISRSGDFQAIIGVFWRRSVHQHPIIFQTRYTYQ